MSSKPASNDWPDPGNDRLAHNGTSNVVILREGAFFVGVEE
jgi:hypothetical protein